MKFHFFQRIKASVSGSDRLERTASLPSLRDAALGHGQPSLTPSSSIATIKSEASDADAMDIDQDNAALSPRTGQVGQGQKAVTGKTLKHRASVETDLEARLASMTIRKIKPLPKARGVSTPKTPTKKVTPSLPTPDAPKKARGTPSATKLVFNLDTLPSMPRKPILKRKTEDLIGGGDKHKKARIAPEATIITSSPEPQAQRRKSVGLARGQGKGGFVSPSRHAAAKLLRKSTRGDWDMDTDGSQH